MASITPPIADPASDDQAIRIERVDADRRRLALAVLLTGHPRESDPAVDQFLGFVREQGLPLNDLWWARRDRRAVAAALLVPAPGGAGMLFGSPILGPAAIDAHHQLLDAVCAAQDPAKLRLVQSLLEPHQRLERQALERSGFEALAVLVYMQRSAQPAPGSRAGRRPRLDLGEADVRALHYSDARRPLFARAIELSYEQTLDCPRLLGVRSMEDILDGHMATGEFDPRLWYVFVKDDEPVGVMLLAKLAPRQSLELVYLGVSLPWRGRGLATRMMRISLDAAARFGALNVLLAVDQNNAPALRLYRGLGFRPTAHKTAMIRTF